MTIGSLALIIIEPPMDYTTMNPGFLCSLMKGWTDMAAVLRLPARGIYKIGLEYMGIYVAAGVAFFLSKAEKMKGQTGENLMISLERRLDNVIFRTGLARTRREARQVVGHKHVLVNGKVVNIPSYQISAGDKIEIREKSKSLQRYKDIVEVTGGRLVPEWMDVNIESFKGTIKNLPTREMIDVPVDEMLIVELYSK